MEIILKIQDDSLSMRRENLSVRDEHTECYLEKQVIIEHEQVGIVTDNQITTRNFFIDHYRFQPGQPVQLTRKLEEDVIQLDFALAGDSQALNVKKYGRHRFSTGQHNMCYVPRSENEHDYVESDQLLDHTVVVIPKAVYFQFVPLESELHRHFVAQMDQQKPVYMASENLSITPAIDWLIRDMRANQRTGTLKRLFIESRLMEVLMLQLEQFQGAPAGELPTQTVDVRKLNEARDLLDASYVNPPTIVELAKLVGLNEFSLKRGFKAQFRTTILGYITQQRMEEAKRFLLEGEKSISEISYWVGYKNPAHFTVAFKHYFGLLPSAVRTQAGNSLP